MHVCGLEIDKRVLITSVEMVLPLYNGLIVYGQTAILHTLPLSYLLPMNILWPIKLVTFSCFPVT